MIKNFYVQEKVRSTFTRNSLQPTGCNEVLKESCKSGLRGPGGPGGPLFALSETPPPRGGPHFSAPPPPPPLKHTFRQLFNNFSQLFVTFFKFSTTFSQNLSKIYKKSALFLIKKWGRKQGFRGGPESTVFLRAVREHGFREFL